MDVSKGGTHLPRPMPEAARAVPVPRLAPADPAPVSAVPDAPAPVDRPAAALFAMGLAGFCAFLGVYATQPLLPLLERVFAVTKAEAALTVSAPTIAVALASPFAGWMVRRWGHRAVIVGALLFLPVPMLLAAASPSIATLVGWRFVQGLAVPGIYAVGVAFLAEEWPPAALGSAMSALITGNVIGGFTGRVLSGLAADLWGWRAAFVVLGLVTAAAAVTAARLLPRARRPRTPDRSAGAPPLRPADLLRAPRLLATFAVGFNVLFTQVAVFTYVTFHLSAPPFRLGSAALSSIFAVYLVGAAVTPLAGRWIDRVGSRRAVTVALAAALAGALLTLAPSVPLVVAGLAAVCTAVFVSQSASTAYLRTAAPPRLRAAASGLYVSCYYLGGAAGGVAPALTWRAGGWAACVAMVAVVQLATVALAHRAWRPA